MSTVKVVDLNNEEAKEEEPTLEPIEESKEEQQPETVNEIVEDKDEEVKETKVKEEVKEAKPKRQTQKDRIQCPKCLKEVSLKTYRYSHEKICGGQLSDKPVKPHAKPKAKQQPKPKHKPPKPPPGIYYSESDDDDDEQPQQPLIKRKQQKQPPNPLLDITNQYALLHQQLMHQKQEKKIIKCVLGCLLQGLKNANIIIYNLK